MTEHTPTPWTAGENSLGVYPIFAKQGPLTVQPAKAFGEDDAAFIVKAVNNHDALVAALEEIEDLGADGVTAARLGNIAHAALISLRVPVGGAGKP